MKVLKEGHLYELDMFEDTPHDLGNQRIQFIEKIPNEKNELITLNNGTTNEEVIEMLINRMEYLQNKFPCEENEICIIYLEKALEQLHKRTKDRINRSVEGKYIK